MSNNEKRPDWATIQLHNAEQELLKNIRALKIQPEVVTKALNLIYLLNEKNMDFDEIALMLMRLQMIEVNEAGTAAAAAAQYPPKPAVVRPVAYTHETTEDV